VLTGGVDPNMQALSKSIVDRVGLAAALVTVVLWASAFAGIRAGLGSYAPISLALLRFLIASSALGIYAVATRMPLPDRKDIPGIMLAGFFGVTVYHIALNTGEQSISAGAASFIVASAPIGMAVLALALYREQLSGIGWAGIALCLLGVTAISVLSGSRIDLNFHALLVLTAAMAQAVYSVWQKRYLQKYGALRFVSYAMWAGTLFMLPFLPGLLADAREATFEATAAVVYMGIFPGALAYVTWSMVLSRMKAAVAGSFLYLVAPTAGLIAWLWLGEIPGMIVLGGGVAILTGVIIVNLYGRVQPATAVNLPSVPVTPEPVTSNS
jgi:drug/metabolite transporter (DMT)-like permease